MIPWGRFLAPVLRAWRCLGNEFCWKLVPVRSAEPAWSVSDVVSVWLPFRQPSRSLLMATRTCFRPFAEASDWSSMNAGSRTRSSFGNTAARAETWDLVPGWQHCWPCLSLQVCRLGLSENCYCYCCCCCCNSCYLRWNIAGRARGGNWETYCPMQCWLNCHLVGWISQYIPTQQLHTIKNIC